MKTQSSSNRTQVYTPWAWCVLENSRMPAYLCCSSTVFQIWEKRKNNTCLHGIQKNKRINHKNGSLLVFPKNASGILKDHFKVGSNKKPHFVTRGKSREADTPGSPAPIWMGTRSACTLLDYEAVFFFSGLIVHKTQSTMEQTYPQPFVSPSATLLGHTAVVVVPPSSIPAYTRQQFYLALSRRKTQPSFPAQILQIHDYSLTLLLFKWLPDWIFSIHKLKIARVSMTCFLEAAFTETLISIIS